MIDPIDYPVTPNRGYRVPPDDVGGVNVANDVPGNLNRLAADIDVDVEAVAAAAAGSVQPSRRVDTGTGLVGGGDLSANVTLALAAGGVDTVHLAGGAVTDDKVAGGIAPAKIAGTAVVEARTVTAGTGLTGGGDLAADRSLGVVFGASAGTVAAGDDARLSETVLVSFDGDVESCAARAGYVGHGNGDPATCRREREPYRDDCQHWSRYDHGCPLGFGPDRRVATSFTIPGEGSVQLISNGSGWLVMQGRYVSKTVGKATYMWDFPGWRLIAYDTGLRDISVAAGERLGGPHNVRIALSGHDCWVNG